MPFAVWKSAPPEKFCADPRSVNFPVLSPYAFPDIVGFVWYLLHAPIIPPAKDFPAHIFSDLPPVPDGFAADNPHDL